MTTSFEEAVRGTQSIAHAFRNGLQAIRSKERKKMICRDARALAGSVNGDDALKETRPNDARWDYGIGIRKANDKDRVAWVEVHPASSSHVQDVIDKLDWLRCWLKSDALLLEKLPPTFVWVASGKVALTPNSPQRRRLSQVGIHFAGARIDLSLV